MKYKEEIMKLQTRVMEGDDKYSSLLESQRLLDLKLLDSQRELVDLKAQYDTKVEELKCENSKAHIKFLNEQAEKVCSSNAFESRLMWFMDKCCTLEKVNVDLKETVVQLRSELDSKLERIKQLDRHLASLHDRLQAKDIVIEQLSMKKPRRRGVRRLLCC